MKEQTEQNSRDKAELSEKIEAAGEGEQAVAEQAAAGAEGQDERPRQHVEEGLGTHGE